MKLEVYGVEMETAVKKVSLSEGEENFLISLKAESDWSPDGGYTFEDVTNIITLDKYEAGLLLKELQAFVELR